MFTNGLIKKKALGWSVITPTRGKYPELQTQDSCKTNRSQYVVEHDGVFH